MDLNWEQIEKLVEEMIINQQKLTLKLGRSIIPNLTSDDILQPNDYLELEHNPFFRYEEGVLTGMQTVQMALFSLKKNQVK